MPGKRQGGPCRPAAGSRISARQGHPSREADTGPLPRRKQAPSARPEGSVERAGRCHYAAGEQRSETALWPREPAPRNHAPLPRSGQSGLSRCAVTAGSAPSAGWRGGAAPCFWWWFRVTWDYMCSSGARGQSASWFGICTLRGTCECWLGRTGPAVCAVASPFWAQASGRHRGSVLSGASEACRLGNGRDASQGKEDLPCAKAGWTQGPRLCDRTVTSFIVSLPFLPSFFWFSSEATRVPAPALATPVGSAGCSAS